MMRFHKMHSMGNDFVVFGSPYNTALPDKNVLTHLCDRRCGIGADCAIYIGKSKQFDYFMHVYNPDGFEAEICGNALKCSAKYVFDRGYYKRNHLFAETLSGTRRLSVLNDSVHAEIGKPYILQQGTLDICGIPLPFASVSVGNPHCVVFVSKLTDDQFYTLAPSIENHPSFPNGTNVEFANIINENNIEMRVWERGIGETLSCITGSCACVAAANALAPCGCKVSVHQRGGIAEITIDKNGNMFNNGKVSTVFTGTIN